MTVPFDLAARPACDDRTRLLALRMLQGSAVATVHAYRLERTLGAVLHGATTDGVVAVVASAASGAEATWGRPVDVRLDLVKNSADPRVSMLVASGHALGSLQWASQVETRAHVADGRLPAHLARALEVPGTRLGFVELERFVLHDLSGAVVVPHAELALAEPSLREEFEGAGLLASHGTADLKDLCWSVLVGRVPGTVIRKAHAGSVCSHTLNQVFCGDVDALGVTVVLVAAHELMVVHARFAQRADSLERLRAEIGRLMEDSAPECTQRI